MQNYSNITKYDNVMYSQEKKESGKREPWVCPLEIQHYPCTHTHSLCATSEWGCSVAAMWV